MPEFVDRELLDPEFWERSSDILVDCLRLILKNVSLSAYSLCQVIGQQDDSV